MSQPWRYSLRIRGRDVDVPEGEITVGRSRTATISLQDPAISRVHIRIVARDGRVMLEDLGSINGTYVNGLRVEGVIEVKDGAQVMLGESEVEVRVEKAPSPLATRRIDTREYICGTCKRPFPEGTKTCPTCDAAPEMAIDVSTADELRPAVSAGLPGAAASNLAADNEPTEHRTGRTGGLRPLDLPPLAPPPSPPERRPGSGSPPRPTRGASPGPLERRKPGFLARLFGRS